MGYGSFDVHLFGHQCCFLYHIGLFQNADMIRTKTQQKIIFVDEEY